MMTRKARGIVCAVSAAILFGLMPVMAKYIYAGGGSALFLSFLRFALALPVLALLAGKSEKERVKLTSSQLRRLVILSLGLGLTPATLFLSYSYIPSGLATTLHYIYPAVVLLVGVLFYREKLRRSQLICCLLCMLGVFLFYAGDASLDIMGVSLALLSGVTYGVYIIYLPKSGLQQEISPARLLLYLQGVGAVIILVLNLIFQSFTFGMSLGAWLMSILFAANVTFATRLFQEGAQLCGAQEASVLSTAEPLTSLVIGIVFFAEPLSLRIVLGIVCVLLSSFLIVKYKE